ncbi:MAG: glycoside hydrolase family 28 protein, partial [Bacteroidota bacterium]|nr:glycoside hydrolase family 28 protein [Bacteroidota bacterium]
DQFEIPIVYQPHFKKDTFPITDYGAVKDGITLNTKSIQSAIDDCAKKGGGTVLFPAGYWLTGPIVLASNVELHAEKGALISFTPDKTQYPLVSSYFEGVEAARCQSPISAKNAENIAITGKGIWNGSGDVWRPLKKGKVTDSEWKKLIASGGVLTPDKSYWYSSASALLGAERNDIGKLANGKQLRDYEAIHDFLRPNMLQFAGCKNILITDATFENSPAWTLHLLMSDQISLLNVTVKNPWYGQNTDGIDLESSTHVLLDGCSFDTGDDGICIKSGRDEEGRKRGLATENVVVQNCTVYHAHGGFVVGSEMSGGAKNLYVSNCNFIGTDIGLRFKTTRGRGGVVENIYASHINMKDIAGEAILFDMYYMAKDPVPLAGEKREMPKIELMPFTEGTPVFRNFFMSDIVCDGAERAIFIRGIPESQIRNIQLTNLVMKTRKGIECTEATQIGFHQVKLLTTDTDPVVYLQNSSDIRLDGLQYKAGATLLFSINGDRSKEIHVLNTDLKMARKQVAFDYGAGSDALDIQK